MKREIRFLTPRTFKSNFSKTDFSKQKLAKNLFCKRKHEGKETIAKSERNRKICWKNENMFENYLKRWKQIENTEMHVEQIKTVWKYLKTNEDRGCPILISFSPLRFMFHLCDSFRFWHGSGSEAVPFFDCGVSYSCFRSLPDYGVSYSSLGILVPRLFRFRLQEMVPVPLKKWPVQDWPARWPVLDGLVHEGYRNHLLI